MEHHLTIPRLPETDLARIAPLSDNKKRSVLRSMRSGFPPFSYRPLRSTFSDIFNLQTGLDFGFHSTTPWEKVVEKLKRISKSETEFKYNNRVAVALYKFASENRVSGRSHEFYPLALSIGWKVSFWLDMVLAIQDQPFAIFIEPRGSKGLNAEGRKFVFSMMHERIRAADEDFADVQLGIIKFSAPKDNHRTAKLYTDEGVDLYTSSELEAMIESTIQIWEEVVAESEHEMRQQATGTGPLI